MANLDLSVFDKRMNDIKVGVVAVLIDDIEDFNNMSIEEKRGYGEQRLYNEGYGMWHSLRMFENALNDDMVDTTNEFIKFIPLE